MAINATIQVRRGLLKDFDPTKMLPGEWAVSIDASTSNQIVWMCFAPGVCKRMGTYEDFQNMVYNATGQIIERYEDAFGSILEEVNTNAEAVSANTDIVLVAKSDIINTYLPQIKIYVSNASASASEAKTYSENAKASASEADKSAEDAKKYSQNAFSTTPEGYEALVGDVDVLKNSIIQTTDRTLYGSKAGGIKLIGIGGASEQGENPSPDNPQEIESVGDIKNLLPPIEGLTSHGITYNVDDRGVVTANGSTTSSADSYEFAYFSNTTALPEWLEKGVEYIASCNSSNSKLLLQCYYYNEDGSAIGVVDTSTSASFTIPETAVGLILRLYVSRNVTLTNAKAYPMIRKASVSNAEYKPYGYSLGIKEKGKNRIKPSAFNEGALYGITVTPIVHNGMLQYLLVNGTSTAVYDTVIGTCDIVNGVTYKMNGGTKNARLIINNGSSNYVDNASPKTFTAEVTATQNVKLYIPSGVTLTDVKVYPMIRKADIEDDTYEPYRSKSITIPLNEPLRKGDEIAVVDGIWSTNRNVASKVFDGSNDEVIAIFNAERCMFVIDVSDIKTVSSTSIHPNLKCTHFTTMAQTDLWGNDGEHFSGISVRANNPQILIRLDGITTVEELRAWLAQNPITIQYELATPIFEPFTDQTPFYGLESFDTVTCISTDSEVEPSIELKFAKTEGDAVTLLNYNGWNLARLENEALKNAVLSLGGNV